MHLVLNTIFCLDKSGCQWALLPKGLAKRSTAFDYSRAWQADGTWQAVLDALRRRVRTAAGREPEPRKAAIDPQTVKGSEAGGARGYDGGERINGRKRHLATDSMGLLPAVLVAAANADDGTAAPEALKKLGAEQTARLDEARGDGKYNTRTPDRRLADSKATYKVTAVGRPAGATGLVHSPYRWVIGRTNAWTGEYRRNSKGYERTTPSSEAMVQIAAIHLMLKRLKPDTLNTQAEFRYGRKSMKKAA